MSTVLEHCPVCRNINGGECNQLAGGFNCDVCGLFSVDRVAYALPDKMLDLSEPGHDGFPKKKRAALSHAIRKATDGMEEPLVITTDFVVNAYKDGLPKGPDQIRNIFLFVGREVNENGELAEFPVSFPAIVGSIDRQSAMKLAIGLRDRNELEGVGGKGYGRQELRNINLTVDGWDRYEEAEAGE